jgi:hypothetical protein
MILDSFSLEYIQFTFRRIGGLCQILLLFLVLSYSPGTLGATIYCSYWYMICLLVITIVFIG